MKAIQLFLIGAMLLAGALVFFRIRTNVFFKPVLMLLLVVGIFFVLFPETTTVIANKVGVDRGADMIFYVYIVTSLIIFIHFYGKQYGDFLARVFLNDKNMKGCFTSNYFSPST